MAAHVKGVMLKARLEYVRQFYGEKGESKLLDSLGPEARAMVGDGILVSIWYPIDHAIELLVKIDEIFGKGDFELSRKMGAQTARTALAGGVQQSFAREHDPGFVLKMTPLIFQQYYDTGRAETETLGPTSALGRILDFEKPHKVLCAGLLGWIEAAMEIWGGEGIRVEEKKCRTRGDNVCEFVAHWNAPESPA